MFHTVTLIRQPQLYNQNKDVFIRREVESVARCICTVLVQDYNKSGKKLWKYLNFLSFFSPLNTLDFPSCHCLVFGIAAALGIRWAPLAGSGAWYTCTEDFGFLKLCESCVTATLVPHVVHEAHGRQHIPSQHYATTTMHFAKCHSKGTLP